MLTKTDLQAIKSIVKDEVKKEISGVKGEINRVREEVGGLRSEMEKNNNTLIELITTGFASHETRYVDYEQRISHLEGVTFKV